MNMRIGEVAKFCGVNVQTIRYYEKERLLPAGKRLPSGYRSYPPEVLRRVRFIKRAQEIGFTLAGIRELLDLQSAPGSGRAEVKRLAEAKLAEIEEKIDTLQRMKTVLAGITKQCGGTGAVCGCPILESIDSQEEI
jgi:DNA-binding transcriptional MerR regulator